MIGCRGLVVTIAGVMTMTILAGAQVAQDGGVRPGFDVAAVYTAADGVPVGERWVHARTGVAVTVLAIESVPQAFLHFRTPPVSDRGEPHTQEHLLLGKGKAGKAVAASEVMSMIESTAYTDQVDTCYALNCAAGVETFFASLDRALTALLFPDYSDEEIRREVWHLGAVSDPATGERHLEERGTVYNEMVTTYEKRWNVFYALQRLVHGATHPYGMSAGGDPDAIRTMTPEHIHTFHRATYRLAPGNGMILALPPAVARDGVARTLDAMLSAHAARPEHQARARGEIAIPPSQPAPVGAPLVVDYPSENESDTGTFVMAWAPVAPGDIASHLERSIFLSAFASGETSWLYRKFLDVETRTAEVAATEVWSSLEVLPTCEAASIGFSGYAASACSAESLARVERLVRDELAAIAALPADSPALAELTRRALVRLGERERDLKERLSASPGFGQRHGGGFWISHLALVDRGGGAQRSLVLADAMAAVRARLAAVGNPWTRVIKELGADAPPYVAVSRPSKSERVRRASAHAERLAAGMKDLLARTGASTPQAALEALAREEDEAARVLAVRDAELPAPRLVADVPMTLDDSLVWHERQIGGARAFLATFASMSAVEVAWYFPLDVVTQDDLVLLPLIPALATGAGFVDSSGKRLRYDEVQEALARETGGIGAGYDLDPQRHRYELEYTASGVDLAEGLVALSWLERVLVETDLSEANLPRLVTLVEQERNGIRQRLGGSEESWVRNPAAALRFQGDHLYLSAGSMHAQLYHLFRLGWLLHAAPVGSEVDAVVALREELKSSLARGGDARDILEDLGIRIRERDATLAPELHGSALAQEIASSLLELVADVPPVTWRDDLLSAFTQIERDLARSPALVLEDLRRLRSTLHDPARARVVITGTKASGETLATAVGEAFARLQSVRSATARPAVGDTTLTLRPGVVARRLAARMGATPAPVHHALVSATSTSGVLLLSAGAADLDELDRKTLVAELAGAVFGGHGPHAFFMNTWAAGLAYSNGLRVDPINGRTSYYAERCPSLVQTMSFVVELARKMGKNVTPELAEYAVALMVSRTRAADRFEDRARAQAADLIVGITPERVRRHRQALLDLLADPDLARDMGEAMATMTGRALVGLGDRSRGQIEPVFLVIGREELVAEWEKYVQERESDYERVNRIWPADFWVR